MSDTLDVVLLFDTEDILSPPEVGNDDSIRTLATILLEEGLRGTFLFIGDRAQHLRDRGRTDVIEAVRTHEVGLHTRSARHPCSPEYVQGRTWDEGVGEALRREREGVEIIRDVFGKAACALSTHYEYATPHSQRAAALLGLPYIYAYPAAPPLYNLSWYAGALGFPYSSPTPPGEGPYRAYFGDFDDFYPDTPAFERMLWDLDSHIEACLQEGQPFLSLFLYHPQRVRLAEFIDRFWCPNGVNYPQERWGQYGEPRRYSPSQVETALGNFRKLLGRIRDDSRLRPLSVEEVVAKYGHQPAEITAEELQQAAQQIVAASGDIPLHTRSSPAEVLMGLSRSMVSWSAARRLPGAVPRDEVMGPKRNLIWYPELQSGTHEELVHLARRVVESVETTGHLPAMFGEPGARVGVNHLHYALAEAYLDASRGEPLEGFRLRPMRRYPKLAEAIGLRYLRTAEGDLMDPDLNVDALYRHGKLQTWTLKPALGAGG
ncbi:MAG: hypothetical protein M3281_09600 [Chloroflexota bacterium]|nr:hypothetical protein [Chloroflexota bacterium]